MSVDGFAPTAASCERGDPVFRAEPADVVPNAAFLVAALAAAGREGAGVIPPAARAPVCFRVLLVLRTRDRAVRAPCPLGTHFLWHLLNAGVLYGLIVTALGYPARPRPARRRAAVSLHPSGNRCRRAAP
ncbi:hypothetical protein [uncultured Methylobacterium sp.]|uniref:hypothetical protein n=1 Tax=uncultured Methylobacterium sp. TaxID=157278 RepID=UPI0035CC8118